MVLRGRGRWKSTPDLNAYRISRTRWTWSQKAGLRARLRAPSHPKVRAIAQELRALWRRLLAGFCPDFVWPPHSKKHRLGRSVRAQNLGFRLGEPLPVAWAKCRRAVRAGLQREIGRAH